MAPGAGSVAGGAKEARGLQSLLAGAAAVVVGVAEGAGAGTWVVE
jgi:hypothetical protein